MITDKFAVLILSSALTSSCGGLFGQQTSGGGSSSIQENGDGSLTAYVNNSVSTSLSAPESSSISGASLSIPSGTLSISAEVDFASGAALDSLASSEFAVSGVASAGSAVSISTSNSSVSILGAMTLSLPVSAAAFLATSQYAVMYNMQTSSGSNIGFIDKSKFLSSSSTKISISISNFGTYQVVSVPDTVKVGSIQPIVETGTLALQGTWQSSCSDKTNDNGDPESQIEKLTISGTKLKYLGSVYSGSGCASGSHLVDTKINADIFVRDSSVSTTYDDLDIMVSSSSILPISSTAANNLNSDSMCGFTNWKVGEEKFIASCPNDTGFPVPGNNILEIFTISGTNLILSEGGDSTVRPTVLTTDPNKYFVKK